MKRKNNKKKFKKIKALVLDFDGVMTDNFVYLDENGKETVRCSRADGLGIEKVKAAGIEVFVLSKEKNKVVQSRCKKLKIPVVQGINNKIEVLKKEIKNRGFLPAQICFLGNDLNDIECIRYAGIGCAVADASEHVVKAADYVTKHYGGTGAVREVCDLILNL